MKHSLRSHEARLSAHFEWLCCDGEDFFSCTVYDDFFSCAVYNEENAVEELCMKLCMLIENTSSRPDLIAEHGLSLYIETKNHKILFDAGQSDAFAENAERMGIDLSQVDIAFLSHGHYDHSGGLMKFLELNDHAPVYMNKRAFGDYWHDEDHYIGIDQTLLNHPRIVLTEDECRIDDVLSLHACNDRLCHFPSSGSGLTVCTDGKFSQDGFLHEQYLLIEEDGRRVLISGCSHKGVLNIADWFRPDVLIGGFHYMKFDPVRSVDFLTYCAQTLMRHPTTYYTCHCTGEAQYAVMKDVMGDRVHYLRAGDTIHISGSSYYR